MNCTHVYVAMATPGWRKCIHCMSTTPPSAEFIMRGTDASPSEPTTADVFDELRQDIEDLGGAAALPRSTATALRRLAMLERRMQEMPGQTFNMLWPVVKPWLKPGSADLVHDEMIKALPSN